MFIISYLWGTRYVITMMDEITNPSPSRTKQPSCSDTPQATNLRSGRQRFGRQKTQNNFNNLGQGSYISCLCRAAWQSGHCGQMRANLKKLQTTFPTSPLFVFTSVQRENSAVLQVGEDWDQVMSKLRAGGPPTLPFQWNAFSNRVQIKIDSFFKSASTKS